MTMVVPEPTTDWMWKSSIRRRVPGRPSPSPLPVENPSCIARSMSGIPGPWSRAVMTIPRRARSVTTSRAISPPLPYVMTLRAISEIAVAMSVSSVSEKPIFSASTRAACRAASTSASWRTGTTRSGVMLARRRVLPALQLDEPLVDVEGRSGAGKAQAKLRHGEGNARLHADDDRVGPAVPQDPGDRVDDARRVRVHDVHRTDVDDDAARPIAASALDQAVAQLPPPRVRQLVLDRCDQDGTDLENGDVHHTSREEEAPLLVPLVEAPLAAVPLAAPWPAAPSARARRSRASIPSCSDPSVGTPRSSAPMVTSVSAMAAEIPVSTTVAPMSRAASHACAR